MIFKDKVQSMTAKEIILSMVESLIPPPLISINMDTFGRSEKLTGLFKWFKKPKCYGCAATNTICKISGVVFNHKNINRLEERAKAVDTNIAFLLAFELAIDQLRKGDIYTYNFYAKNNFATIDNTSNILLPRLNTNYTLEDLEPYKRLAEMQETSSKELTSE